MALNFEKAAYDVVVALEVLSHIADQAAFVRKVSSLLKPGGYLMLATQNRYVLERFNSVAPPEPWQLRQWVDKRELGRLLDSQLTTLEVFSVSPKANKGLLRAINSPRVNRPVRALFGNRIELLKEHLGLGWTLMALARKP